MNSLSSIENYLVGVHVINSVHIHTHKRCRLSIMPTACPNRECDTDLRQWNDDVTACRPQAWRQRDADAASQVRASEGSLAERIFPRNRQVEGEKLDVAWVSQAWPMFHFAALPSL